MAPFAPAAPSRPHPQSFAPIVPEPTKLAAALDAAGARPVPINAPATPARPARDRRRVERIKIAVAVVVLTIAALAGPPLVRWFVDQVNGGTDPLAPRAPAGPTELVDQAVG